MDAAVALCAGKRIGALEHRSSSPHGGAQAGEWDKAEAAAIISAHAGQPGATLPILHALQAAYGFVPRLAQPMIAEALNLSRAEIHGVVSFYHDFRSAPPGRHVLKLCRAEACQAMGAAAVNARALRQAGIAWGGTTADGALTIEPAYCLGLCACAPAALLDGEPVGRLDDAGLAALVAQCREEAAA
jgi:formate dehydrogenase subunit gamma